MLVLFASIRHKGEKLANIAIYEIGLNKSPCSDLLYCLF